MSFIRSRSIESSTSLTDTSENYNNLDSQNSIQNSIHNNITKNIYKPPYNSSWFETENGLPLETYIKYHLKIAHDYFSCNIPKDTTKGIIVPHAGIRFSGICSAAAYYQLAYRTTPIKRVILLCNSHHSGNGNLKPNPEDFNIYLPEYKSIQSFRNSKTHSQPQKPILIDTKTINTLAAYLATNLNINIKNKNKSNPQFISRKQFFNNSIFENEHSFYNQLPFLEIIAPGAIICPIIIGSMVVSTPTNSHGIDLLNKFLAAVLEKQNTVIICSSDFTKNNTQNNTQNNSQNNSQIDIKIPNNFHQNIRKLDSDLIQFIYNKMNGVVNKNRKIDLVDDFLFMSNTSACGITALYIFSKLFNLISTSGNTNNPYSNPTSSDSSGSPGSPGSPHSPHSPHSQIIQQSAYKNTRKSKTRIKLNRYYPRLACYYTSPTREHIQITDYLTNPNLNKSNLAAELTQLPTNLSITGESVSYSGIVVSRQPYINDHSPEQLTGLLTQFEKCVLHEFTRGLIRGTITPSGIAPIFSGAFRLNLGVLVNLVKTGIVSDSPVSDIISVGNLDPTDEGCNMIMTIRQLAGQIRNQLTSSMLDISKLSIQIGLFNGPVMITPSEYFSDIFNPNHDIIRILQKSRGSGYILPLPLSNPGGQNTKKQLLENLCLDVLGMESRNCFRGNQPLLSYNAGLIF